MTVDESTTEAEDGATPSIREEPVLCQDGPPKRCGEVSSHTSRYSYVRPRRLLPQDR